MNCNVYGKASMTIFTSNVQFQPKNYMTPKNTTKTVSAASEAPRTHVSPKRPRETELGYQRRIADTTADAQPEKSQREPLSVYDQVAQLPNYAERRDAKRPWQNNPSTAPEPPQAKAQHSLNVYCHQIRYIDGDTLSVKAVKSKPRETIHMMLELKAELERVKSERDHWKSAFESERDAYSMSRQVNANLQSESDELLAELKEIRNEAVTLVDTAKLPTSVLHIEAPKRIKDKANSAIAKVEGK